MYYDRIIIEAIEIHVQASFGLNRVIIEPLYKKLFPIALSKACKDSI